MVRSRQGTGQETAGASWEQQGTRDRGAIRQIQAGLFAVSTAVLTLEVLQVKIFAFSLDPLTIYLALGICLLGLGASATVLALAPRIPETKVRTTAAAFAAAGAAAVPVAHVVFAQMGLQLRDRGIADVVALIALTVPYFCLGMVITILFVARGAAIGRAYAVNLAGSGLGCLIIFPLLDRLGAERVLVVVMGLALGAALLLAPAGRPRIRGALITLICLALSATLMRLPTFLQFPPDPTGQLSLILIREAQIKAKYDSDAVSVTPVFTRWDQTARIDVYELDGSIPELQARAGGPIETRFLLQDAAAGSILLGVGDDLRRAREFFEGTVYGAGYAQGTVRDVLIIGLGGAPDVQTALYHGAGSIVGVDINRTTIDLVRNDFGSFLGNPYRRPQVIVHQMDGRTFLRRPGKSYDLIQMTGVDTKSVFASGSLSVNENYLYTREAMGELLTRLRPNGVLAINRFSDFNVHRLASIAVAGLHDIGEANPERHIIAITQGYWRSILVKRTPYTAGEIERVHEWVERWTETAPDVVIPAYDMIGLTLSVPMQVIYSPEPRYVATTPYFQALGKGQLAAFVASARWDLSAPVDDRPFFFLNTRPSELLRSPPFVMSRLYKLVAQLSAVATVFILAPLVALRWRGLRAPRAGRTLVYFTCLGAAFMLVEVGLINRFVLLLGHQSYAVTVVLFGLLCGAGCGSLISGRLPASSRWALNAVLLALALLILGYALGLDTLFNAASGATFYQRLVLALTLLVALGFLLGIPFPTGLRSLHASNLPLVAWGVGINGFASVVGATLAVPVAMLVGFRMLLFVGALLYVVAILTAPLAERAISEPIPPSA